MRYWKACCIKWLVKCANNRAERRSLATDTQDNIIAAGVGTAGSHDIRVLKEQVEDYAGITTIFADDAFKGEPPFDKGGKIKWKIVSRKGGLFQSASQTPGCRKKYCLAYQL